MERKFLKWAPKNGSVSFHRSGFISPVRGGIWARESHEPLKRGFSDALTQFPCPHTFGVLLKPCSWAFSTYHWRCCPALGKTNGPWCLRQQLIFLQRLDLGRAKQRVLCVPKQGLLLLEASIWIFLNPKLWAFVCRKPVRCGHSRLKGVSKPRDLQISSPMHLNKLPVSVCLSNSGGSCWYGAST